jgi:hypothetical protein
LFYSIKGVSVRSQVETFNLGKVSVLKLLEDIHGGDHELDGPFAKGIQDIKHSLQRGAVSFLDGNVLEIVDEFLLWGGVLEFM